VSRHRRVVWSEGMLLSPQHLQQLERYTHRALDERLRGLQPFASGFTHLKLDRDQLRNGRLGILEARGVLPDGTAFAVPEDDPAPAPRAIADHFAARQESVAVYLGMPGARPGRAQLGEAANPGTPGPRYTAEAVELADDNDTASTRPITIARRNLCVLFPEDALDEHDILPVTELIRTGQGSYAPREDFVPPCLAIEASEFLMSRIESVHEMVITKSDELASRRSLRGDLADFTPGDFAGFGQLMRANAFIPLLGHMVQSRRAHPEAAYQLLVSLAGELCTFSARVSAKKLPHYDHQALGATFKELHSLLMQLLRIRDETRWVLIALEKRDSLFLGQVEDPRLFERDASFYLAASADMEKDRLLRDLPVKVKIASQSQIDTIIELALPGVIPVFTQDPPVAIPRKPNFFYFKLSPSGDAWDSIKGSKNVAIYAPADMPGLSFELVGLRE
jgi:type VI secretion system protein ImpJ